MISYPPPYTPDYGLAAHFFGRLLERLHPSDTQPLRVWTDGEFEGTVVVVQPREGQESCIRLALSWPFLDQSLEIVESWYWRDQE